MVTRINTKIGDVFSVKINEKTKKYFQLIAYDLTQLNSDVIRAFKDEYSIDYKPNIAEIISGEVDFHAHCVTKLGLKMNLWEKVGNSKEVGDLAQILFRGSSDSGSKSGEKLKVSNKWYVWRINDDDVTRVGKLQGENRNAELGIVVNPFDVVERMKTGKYNFFYPDFE